MTAVTLLCCLQCLVVAGKAVNLTPAEVSAACVASYHTSDWNLGGLALQLSLLTTAH